MIGWQNLAAFWALPLLAIPIIVHLLRVHRADRVLFPSLRFVQPSRTAAVRVRMPSDVLLLALRLSIVAIVIAALASPVVVTPSRLQSWNARTTRAIVVDTSASMRADGGARAVQAKEAASAESRTATTARIFESADLSAAVQRATAWFQATPPGRREIVVLSDFQRGAFTQTAVALVPASVGLKLVAIGRSPDRHTVDLGETLGAPGVAPRHQTLELTSDSTTTTFTAREGEASPGVRFVNASPGEQTALLRALAHAGTPAGSDDHPIVFVFDADKNTAALQSLAPVRERWMLRTLLRLHEDPAFASSGGVRSGSDPSAPKELVIGVAAPASSFAAATLVRAALVARRPVDDYTEQEIARTNEATLTAWNRQAAPVDRDAWRTAESTDARWCWLIALALLGIEQWLRSRSAVARSREVTRAAA